MNIFLLAREVGEKTTNTIRILSIFSIALLVVVFAVIAITNKGYDTKSIVFAAVTIAASFVLAFIKFTPVVYGGSITLASFVPVLIYVYSQGLAKGLLVGVVFGLLNFIESPYILVPETFVLDYILGFTSIALMSQAPKFSKNLTVNILLGCGLVYFARFTMHFISGMIYFNYGIIANAFPTESGVLYSLIYNLTYLVPDMLICMIAFYTLIKTKNFDKILAYIKK